MSEPAIKVLLSILGMDQHETGAMAVAAVLRDAGMEVVYQGRFNLPPALVRAAVDEGVDVIGISSHSWEYLYFLDELFDELKKLDEDIPVIVGGSVVTEKDRREILGRGVAAAFGTIDSTEHMIAEITRIARARRG